MHKDYIVYSGTDAPEATFIEQYWTDNWKNAGGVEGRVTSYLASFDRFALKSEWRLMSKYMSPQTHPKLLDGGCGTGEWCRYLDAQGYSTIGMDISKETIVKLQELFPDALFQAGDIRATGLDDNAIDAMYSWGTFEHFETGLQPCIQEAFRVIRPGGLLFITVPYDSFGFNLVKMFQKAPKTPDGTNRRFYQWRLNRTELAKELTMGGFEVLKQRPIHRRQTIVRALHHTFGVHYDNRVVRAIGFALGAILPRALCGHMLMAVARKPD